MFPPFSLALSLGRSILACNVGSRALLFRANPKEDKRETRVLVWIGFDVSISGQLVSEGESLWRNWEMWTRLTNRKDGERHVWMKCIVCDEYTLYFMYWREVCDRVKLLVNYCEYHLGIGPWSGAGLWQVTWSFTNHDSAKLDLLFPFPNHLSHTSPSVGLGQHNMKTAALPLSKALCSWLMCFHVHDAFSLCVKPNPSKRQGRSISSTTRVSWRLQWLSQDHTIVDLEMAALFVIYFFSYTTLFGDFFFPSLRWNGSAGAFIHQSLGKHLQ